MGASGFGLVEFVLFLAGEPIMTWNQHLSIGLACLLISTLHAFHRDRSKRPVIRVARILRVPDQRALDSSSRLAVLYRMEISNTGAWTDNVSVQLKSIDPPLQTGLLPLPLHLTGDNTAPFKTCFVLGKGIPKSVDVIAIAQDGPIHLCYLYKVESDSASSFTVLDGSYIFTIGIQWPPDGYTEEQYIVNANKDLGTLTMTKS